MSTLTRDQVIDVAGPLDDIKVAEIIATGATLEELEEAVAWANGDNAPDEELGHPLAGRVARIYEILTVDQVLAEEE